MSQIIRGARKVNGEMQPQSAARWPQSQQHNVGFRLVYDGSDRVSRGGSWDLAALRARVANRSGSDPGRRHDDLGFRLVFDREDT